MPTQKLPHELVSLVHHIELNKADWWAKGLQRLILAAVWLAEKPTSTDTVAETLRQQFSVTSDAGRVRREIDSLLGEGTLIELPGQGIQISERALKEFEQALSEVDEIEKSARQEFLSCMEQHCPSFATDDFWKVFNQQLLMPLIQDIGARTYQMLSASGQVLESTFRFVEFLEKYPEDDRRQLREAVVSFLNPKSSATRSYVLRSLNTYFFLEAGNLSQDTITGLTNATANPPTFFIFVDTNFLFSILNFHDNPSNEAAESLMTLIRELPKNVSCKLYAFPLTIDETKRVVGFHRDNFKRIRMTHNLAEAVSTTNLSGISRKYIAACQTARLPLTAEEYFDPYLTNLIPILRSKGVEVFNERVEGYRTRQDVIDDILTQVEFEKTRHKNRPKTYEELEHDVILWHFTRDKRPATVESALQAKYFVVTVDYHFLGFDSFKRRSTASGIPTCLHPNALIQLLQFWLPRSEKFEEAVVGSLRWRFLWQEFDPNAEKVTLRILETLSRYENLEDLSPEVVKAILINEALRQKLVAERDVQKQVDLVKEALIEESTRIAHELQKAQEESKQFREQIAEQVGIISDFEKRESSQAVESEKLHSQLHTEREARRVLGSRVDELEKRHLRESAERTVRRDRAVFSVNAGASLFLALLFALGLSRSVRTGLGVLSTAVLFCSAVGFIWIWLIDRVGSKSKATDSWHPFVRFHKLKVWFFGALGTIVLGALGNALYEWWKRSF